MPGAKSKLHEHAAKSTRTCPACGSGFRSEKLYREQWNERHMKREICPRVRDLELTNSGDAV